MELDVKDHDEVEIQSKKYWKGNCQEKLEEVMEEQENEE
jgi:hypothetical protein